jgi:hypothetical protein
MKTVALAIALLMGGTALAQTTTNTGADNGPGTAGYSSQSSTTDVNGQPQQATDSSMTQTTTSDSMTITTAPAGQTMAMNTAGTGTIVQPSNANPRRDERGIPVISMAAVVPAGWNGTPGTSTGMGGPLLDPNTGQPVSDTGNYPACTRHTTDKCVQTYERHRR